MEQQLTMLTTNNTHSNVEVTSITATKELSTKQIIDTVLTSEHKVVAATLHDAHFDSNFDSNNNASDSGTTTSDTGTSIDDSSSISVDNNAGIGPILDMTAYNRFESTLAKLQVHASDIVRVDNHVIGTGGFAKVYKVLLKGSQLCAAKVSLINDTLHILHKHDVAMLYVQ
jgi:hypothetical protein